MGFDFNEFVSCVNNLYNSLQFRIMNNKLTKWQITINHVKIQCLGWALQSLTHIINEVANFFWVGGARPVLRSWHEVWHNIVPEHLWPVVQTTVKNTQIIVLTENTRRDYTLDTVPVIWTRSVCAFKQYVINLWQTHCIVPLLFSILSKL